MSTKPTRNEEILSSVYYKTYANDQDPQLPLYSKPFFRNIILEAMGISNQESFNEGVQSCIEVMERNAQPFPMHTKELITLISQLKKPS